MKFKVGDKVKVASTDYWFKKSYVGKEFTINTINPNSEYVHDIHYGVGAPFIFMESELMPVIDSKIVITTDGKITTAKLYENSQLVKAVEAKCHPEDTFDFNVGAKLAVERLTAPVDEWKVVKRPVKVGDYIRLILADYSFDKVGDILKVDEIVGSTDVLIYKKNHPNKSQMHGMYVDKWCYTNTEYEIIEKVTKEFKEAPKYYNGKVVCITNYYEDRTPISGFTIGKVYTVTDGVIVSDNGFVSMQYRDIESLCGGMGNTFIPLVEN